MKFTIKNLIDFAFLTEYIKLMIQTKESLIVGMIITGIFLMVNLFYVLHGIRKNYWNKITKK